MGASLGFEAMRSWHWSILSGMVECKKLVQPCFPSWDWILWVPCFPVHSGILAWVSVSQALSSQTRGKIIMI